MRRLLAAAATILLTTTAAAARDPPGRRIIVEARDEVFARPEFRQRARDGESVVVAALRTFAKYVVGFRDEHPVAFMVIVGFMALTLVILVAHIVWTVVVARRARYLPSADELPALDVRRTPPEDFRARAVRLAGEGHFDAAVRDLYTALVLTLDRRGDLAYARHKALLDYRTEVRADDARSALESFARSYHPTSFGRRPLSAERFAALLAQLDGVRT